VVFGETNPNFFNVYMGALKHDGGPTAKRKSAQSTQIGEWSRWAHRNENTDLRARLISATCCQSFALPYAGFRSLSLGSGP